MPREGIAIANVSLQSLENDSRVLRTIAALEKAGYVCPVVAPGHGLRVQRLTAARKARMALSCGTAARLGHKAAQAAFFSLDHHRDALDALLRLNPDAIHAHDWDGLIVGARAARTLGIPFAYDAHELAAHMHAERRLWSLAIAPLIGVLEGPAAREAAFVVAVSDGLAAALRTAHRLECPVMTIRNIAETPAIDRLELRDPEAPILMHYHGILARGRGLEAALDAMETLPEKFHLRLTGPWRQPVFKAHVCERLADSSIGDRIEIVEPIAHNRLVAHAIDADIGLCMLPPGSRHNAIALPNKVFDYLKAGLGVIASGSNELDWIEQAGAARLLDQSSGPALAQALLSLDRAAIDTMRARAVELGRLHSWQDEKLKLTNAWAGLRPLMAEGKFGNGAHGLYA